MALTDIDRTNALMAMTLRVDAMLASGKCAHDIFEEVHTSDVLTMEEAAMEYIAQYFHAFEGGTSNLETLEFVARHALVVMAAYGFMIGRLEERSELPTSE